MILINNLPSVYPIFFSLIVFIEPFLSTFKFIEYDDELYTGSGSKEIISEGEYWEGTRILKLPPPFIFIFRLKKDRNSSIEIFLLFNISNKAALQLMNII